MNEHNLPPAQLWIGSPDILIAEVMTYLQQQFCPHAGCGLCVTCTQLRAQQHHAVIWMCPEKQYTLEDLEIIQERLAFTLSDDEQLFFILQKADYLSKQCANSLLKSIEEPPKGYRFILCAERIENVLATIQSRCIVKSFAKEGSAGQHQELYAYFSLQSGITQQSDRPITFLSYLQKSTVNETDSIELIDRLLGYWIQKYTSAVLNKQPHALALKHVNMLKKALINPPMPGGSKLFWKNLYTQFYT